MTLSEQGYRLLFLIQLLSLKIVLVLNVSVKIEKNWIKDEEAAPI